MAEEIIIYTASPKDVTFEEAEEIAAAVRGLSPSYEVRVEGKERTGYGVTYFEVLRIVLLGGAFGAGKVFAEEVAKKIADITVEWARERFKGRKSKSKRPVYVSISYENSVLKSLVIKNATDEPEDRTEQDQGVAKNINSQKVIETKPAANALPGVAPPTCGGNHLCPSCREVKTCAFGSCSSIGKVKCDSCLYIEEYGTKAASIIEKAIAVAAMLHEASGRLAQFLPEGGPQPFATKEDARIWSNKASRALEELDTALNRIHLRLKARHPGMYKS